MLNNILRVGVLAVIVGWPLTVALNLATDVFQQVRAIGKVTFAIMDMQVRTLHYVVPHTSKVDGCRECNRELHKYLNGLEREHPEYFLEPQ